MKIQPINNTQTFKGLFVDCSKENGGDWKMVYRPYSWELKDSKTPIMSSKTPIDILADYLPDNEEIFIPMQENKPEISKDILGTVSYYKYPASYNNGEMRRQIIFGEPLSREESLNIYLQKLDKFVEMKHNKQSELEKSIQSADQDLQNLNNNFGNSSCAYERTSLGFNKHKREMDKFEKDMYQQAKTLHKNAIDYIKINSSLQSIEKQKLEMQEELAMIENARNNNVLVDISKRHLPDPNKAYWQVLVEAINNKNIRLNTDKVIVFPHATKTLKSLIEGWFKSYNVSPHFDQYVLDRIPGELMSCADSMIYHFKRCNKPRF